MSPSASPAFCPAARSRGLRAALCLALALGATGCAASRAPSQSSAPPSEAPGGAAASKAEEQEAAPQSPPEALEPSAQSPLLQGGGNAAELDALEEELREAETKIALQLSAQESEARRTEVAAARPVAPARSGTTSGAPRASGGAAASSAAQVARKKSSAESPAADESAYTPAPAPEDRCETACRALASMQRAKVRICALVGDGEARCRGAEERVTTAGQRVAQIPCGCER